jgi:nucleoid-associated protein EbfC
MNFNMIKQAQELKSKLDKAQKELAKTIVEGESGKGAVKVTANGQQKIMAIKIDSEVIDPKKTKQLEELVLKAVTDALDKSQKAAADRLKEVTGGIKIPGLM